MKIKTLIKLLSKQDPESKVVICVHGSYEMGACAGERVVTVRELPADGDEYSKSKYPHGLVQILVKE